MSDRPIFRAIRLEGNPIIHSGLCGLEGGRGENINGPSLIRVPEWIENPLGRYYLYFAHHGGAYIRLAFADDLQGPWRIHEPGVLHVEQAPCIDHIASPDVHVDQKHRRIRLYFHGPEPGGNGQRSYLAVSEDGLGFTARPEPLGWFYFRVFEYGGWHYAFAKCDNLDGVIYRSRDGFFPFEEGPHFLPNVRHTALLRRGSTLHVFYSRVGDCPESVCVSQVDLTRDWMDWELTGDAVVLSPEEDYEGAGIPPVPTSHGSEKGAVCALRDPAIFEEEGRTYLLYSVAGEQGIALARLETIESA